MSFNHFNSAESLAPLIGPNVSHFYCPSPLAYITTSVDPEFSTKLHVIGPCVSPCPTVDFSNSDWRLMTKSMTVLVFMSIIMSILCLVAHVPDFRRFFIRIMFITGFFGNSIVFAVFLLHNNGPRNDENNVVCNTPSYFVEKNALCVFQAAATIWFFMWTNTWSAILSIDTYLRVCAEISKKRLEDLKYVYLLMGIIIPTACTLIPLCNNNLGFDPYASIPVCLYMISETRNYFWASFVLPFYTLLFIAVVLSILTGRKIHNVLISSNYYQRSNGRTASRSSTSAPLTNTGAPVNNNNNNNATDASVCVSEVSNYYDSNFDELLLEADESDRITNRFMFETESDFRTAAGGINHASSASRLSMGFMSYHLWSKAEELPHQQQIQPHQQQQAQQQQQQQHLSKDSRADRTVRDSLVEVELRASIDLQQNMDNMSPLSNSNYRSDSTAIATQESTISSDRQSRATSVATATAPATASSTATASPYIAKSVSSNSILSTILSVYSPAPKTTQLYNDEFRSQRNNEAEETKDQQQQQQQRRVMSIEYMDEALHQDGISIAMRPLQSSNSDSQLTTTDSNMSMFRRMFSGRIGSSNHNSTHNSKSNTRENSIDNSSATTIDAKTAASITPLQSRFISFDSSYANSVDSGTLKTNTRFNSNASAASSSAIDPPGWALLVCYYVLIYPFWKIYCYCCLLRPNSKNGRTNNTNINDGTSENSSNNDDSMHSFQFLNKSIVLFRSIWRYNGPSMIFVVVFCLSTIAILPIAINMYIIQFDSYVDSATDFEECLITASFNCPTQTQDGVNQCGIDTCGEVPQHRPNVAQLMIILCWASAYGIIPSVLFGFAGRCKPFFRSVEF